MKAIPMKRSEAEGRLDLALAIGEVKLGEDGYLRILDAVYDRVSARYAYLKKR